MLKKRVLLGVILVGLVILIAQAPVGVSYALIEPRVQERRTKKRKAERYHNGIIMRESN